VTYSRTLGDFEQFTQIAKETNWDPVEVADLSTLQDPVSMANGPQVQLFEMQQTS